MLSILIIDDTEDKRVLLTDFLVTNFEEIKHSDIDYADSTNTGMKLMSLKQYDLVLLDLFIPVMSGQTEKANPENAANLLNLLNESDMLHMPAHILGITRMKLEDIIAEHQVIFDNNLWSLLHYGDNDNGWEDKLMVKIKYLLRAKRQLLANPSYDFDVAIYTALDEPESEWLRNVFGDDWIEYNHPADKTTTYLVKKMQTTSGKVARVVLGTANTMGASAASAISNKMIYNFRPKYFFMTGISAATNDDGGKINFGDVIVSSEAIDSGNGKFTQEEGNLKFTPDPKTFNTDPAFLTIVDRLKKDVDVLIGIQRGFKYKSGCPNTILSVHKGQVGSVPAVVANKDIVDEMCYHHRYLQGVEMEAYGMYFGANYAVEPRPKYIASLKAVSDYADPAKNNHYREYASYTSAAVLKHIIENYLEF